MDDSSRTLDVWPPTETLAKGLKAMMGPTDGNQLRHFGFRITYTLALRRLPTRRHAEIPRSKSKSSLMSRIR